MVSRKKEIFILLLGDILAFIIALYATLIIRYGEFPSKETFYEHLAPFAVLFVVWISTFFIAGLYNKHTLILKNKIASIILNAQVANTVMAVLFFYLIPYFGITPKTNLFIYLFFSFNFIVLWRMYGYEHLNIRKKQPALLIGSGDELKELKEEINNNTRYNLNLISSIDLEEIDGLDIRDEIVGKVYSEDVTDIIVDLHNEKVEQLLPHLYNLLFSRIRFVDMHKVYEDIFDRIPLSLVRYSWFLENISTTRRFTYDALKRITDTVLGGMLGVLSLIVYPLVWLAILFDDSGSLFIVQPRIGKNNRMIYIIKFRSMLRNDNGVYTQTDKENRITRVGAFLRKTRIDELPQLWNVFLGDLSLVGPRPELPDLVKVYEREVPYYNVRHLIKPGLSGWAQLYHDNHPHHQSDVSETRVKLSYDLFYIKNRSFILDIKIALRTAAILLSRRGK